MLPGDVAQHDQRRMAPRVRAAAQRNDVGAGAQAGTQRRAHVDQAAVRVRRQAPRAHFRDGQPELRDHPLGLGQLGGGHGLEVGALQQFALGYGEGGVQLHLPLLRVRRFLSRPGAREQRFGHSIGRRGLRPPGRGRPGLGNISAMHALEHARVAPEDVEGLVEQLELLAAIEEQRRQRPVEIVAVLRCPSPRAPSARR